MANTRSSRHGKRRRQACGLDLSPREVGHEDRHETSLEEVRFGDWCVAFVSKYMHAMAPESHM